MKFFTISFFGFIFVATHIAFADPRTAALKLRYELQRPYRNESYRAEQPAATIKLRTTDFLSQGSSQFCWVFAGLSVLETNFLSQHNDIDPKSVKLSPWYFIRATGSFQQRGTAVDALYYYSPKIGLVTYADSPTGQPVSQTTFLGVAMPPLQLRSIMLNTQQFWAYAFSDTRSGWGDHPDPDHLPGTKAFYLPRSRMPEILKQSLKMGKAVAFGNIEHIVEIFGADFDSEGNAINYFIKDSVTGFYVGAAGAVYRNIADLTTVAGLK